MSEPLAKNSFAIHTSGDRLIRVSLPAEGGNGFCSFTFPETEAVGVMSSNQQDRSALVLRSGMKIPVALKYEDLEQKIYLPNFRTDGPVLDLRNVTGEAAKPSKALAGASDAPANTNQAPSTTPASVVDPGDKMPDGTVFAGISPDTNKPMYATPADAPLTMKFNEAQEYAARFDAHGHKDWRVPTMAELNVLFNNCAAIGRFDISGSTTAGWYWSASPYLSWGGWAQRFSDGAQGDDPKGRHSPVRPVR
jgi:hypothetical protein